MNSLPSRSHRWHPFAFFIAIGYGSKYFTPAVTPPGSERRARSAYARDAFVLAARSAPAPAFVISRRHLAPGRYTLRGPERHSGPARLYRSVDVRHGRGGRSRPAEISSDHTEPGTPRGIPASRASNWSACWTPDSCPGRWCSKSDPAAARTQLNLRAAGIA